MDPHRSEDAEVAPRAPSPRPAAAKGWGVVSVVILAAGLLPLAITFVVATVLDPLYGWFIIVALPLLLLAAAISAVLGIVGLVIAMRRQNGYLWPLIGLGPSAAILIVLFTVYVGR